MQSHPVPLYYDLVHNLILPNWGLFGALVMVTELFAGVTLVLGIFTPLGALAAAAFTLNLNFANWDRNIWMWEYAVEYIPLTALALMRAGRFLGLDARLRHRFPRWPLT